MAIDTSKEQLVSLRDAAQLLPARRKGKKPHISCLYRWTVSGCRGVVLESVSVGGTRCTSREALTRFIEKLSATDRDIPPSDSSSAQADHMAMVEQELDKEGIK